MPVSRREKVDTARAIKNILDSYPESGILRELLQNSDDAQATSQIFILDHRKHRNSSLVDPSLAESQGPALLAYNDTSFKESDWIALDTLNSSNKTRDETKTGKYGLGIRACYHVTENLQVLSESKLVIYDPQDHFAATLAGGAEISLVDEGHLYLDQISAFQVPGVFNIAVGREFNGTIVRLALRTKDQANCSRIKSSAVSPETMRAYFQDFVADELELDMLFLKHITSIRLLEVDRGGRVIPVAEVHIQDPQIADKRAFIRGADIPRFETFKCPIIFRSGNHQRTTTWRVVHSISVRSETASVMRPHMTYDVDKALVEDKLFAHVALAFPLHGSRIDGKLFTLLPLPILTDFPLHIHSIFALTPDRQHLRSREEKGFDEKSREFFLVKWNELLFQHYIPRVWVRLFQILITEDEQIITNWSAWPPNASSHHEYWGTVLQDILKVTSSSDPQPAIFPSSTSFVSLSPSLVGSPDEIEQKLIDALSRVGVPVITPPIHILQILSTIQPIVNCQNVYGKLLGKLGPLQSASADDKVIFLDYLIPQRAPFTLENIIDLPIIPIVGGTHDILKDNAAAQFILASEIEMELFTEYHSRMVPAWQLSNHVREAFSIRPPLHKNLVHLTQSDVFESLNTKFGHHNPALDEINDTGAELKWLVMFWSWMTECPIQKAVANKAGRFHLLPTQSRTLRTLDSRLLLPIQDDGDAMKAWESLGVPFLHHSIPVQSGISLGFGVSADNIPFLLDHLKTDRIPSLTRKSSTSLRKYLIRIFQSNAASNVKHSWTQQQVSRYIRLPIFSQRKPNLPQTMSRCVDGVAIDDLQPVYVNVSDDQPVPSIEGTILLDVSKGSRVLVSPIPLTSKGPSTSKGLDELGVLRLAAKHLDTQSPENLDALISRFLPRLSDMPELVETLRQTRFVPIANSRERFKPAELVDPSSMLRELYAGELDKFPDNNFSTLHLSTMKSHRLFLDKLTAEVITERVRYIAAAPDRKDKAMILLRLLDTHWKDDFAAVTALATEPWLPAVISKRPPLTQQRATQCRDQIDADLFNLVLPVVSAKLDNLGLRRAMGWSGPIPFDVIRQQFVKLLGSTPVDGNKAMNVITRLSQLFGDQTISPEDVGLLRQSVEGRRWIPISRTHLEDTQHGLLTKTSLSRIFHTVPDKLRSGRPRDFLVQMGCLERPSIECLLAELNKLPAPPVVLSDIAFEDTLGILDILSSSPSPLEQVHRTRIRVPDETKRLRPTSEVYFPDSEPNAYTTIPVGLFPSHPKISKAVAIGIGLQFASDLLLGDDEDEDEDNEDMEEDLQTRINGQLKAIGVENAFNEFFANAADAKASVFESLIDETLFQSRAIISPAMACLQGPSLLLYNNGTFSDEDFKGIRRIGRGAKGENPGTIGRHGLGALSLFHFSSVAFIVSGLYMLILDPSGKYLPPHKGRKRTALFRKLSSIANQYPDQLAPFEGLFGFSSKSNSGDNELFYPGACNALFFTSLNSISARHHQQISQNLWSVSASRSTESASDSQRFYHHRITLTIDQPLRQAQKRTESWIITKSLTAVTFAPPECTAVLHDLKLKAPDAKLVVRLALPAPLSQSGREHSHLFSSLRLPAEETSLPVHIDAQFALAQDRRNIRFEPADPRGNRVPEAAYNLWILQEVVPPLYLWSISVAQQKVKAASNFQWWPETLQVKDEKSETVGNVVGKALFATASTTSEKIFRTFNGLVAPASAVFSCGQEPYDVTRILRHIRAPDLVELPYQISRYLSMTELSIVDPSFVVENLRRFSGDLTSIFSRNKDGNVTDELGILIRFILSPPANLKMQAAPTPWDLRILLIAGSQMVTFPDSSQPSLYWRSTAPPTIFPSSSFIHHEFSKETVTIMQKASINVRIFDETAIVALLKAKIPVGSLCNHSAEDRTWIGAFWEFLDSAVLSEQANISTFDDLPIIATYSEDSERPEDSESNGAYVSLQWCKEQHGAGAVIRTPKFSATDTFFSNMVPSFPGLRSLLQRLGVRVLRYPSSQITENILPKFSFQEVLKCLKAQSQRLYFLQQADREQLAEWIRRCIDAGYSTSFTHQTLRSLPIWPAFKNYLPCFVDAISLKMLPQDTDLTPFLPFINANVAVCRWTPQLKALGQQPLTQNELFAALPLPRKLPTETLDSYHALLSIVFGWSQRNRFSSATMLEVPDETLSMRPVGELYDKTIPLFQNAFLESPGVFVHPRFDDLQQELRAWGLRHQITFEYFRRSAEAIHEDHLNDPFNVERAATVFHYYNNELPRELDLSITQWKRLDGYAFIPRSPDRRPRATYETAFYGKSLPAVLPPSQMLRNEYESVAWTQRGLFSTIPSRQLLSEHSTLGVPEVYEVVAHLRVLALEIAPDRSPRRNMSLLEDLEATYGWLADKAPAIIAQHLDTSEAVFLNVDDPKTDEWEWSGISNLWFNIRYADQGRIPARSFLERYKPLLKALGAHEMKNAKLSHLEGDGGFEEGDVWLKRYDSMRHAKKLTDFKFQLSDEHKIDADEDKLWGHRSFLAASIPHLNLSLTEGWAESDTASYPFDGSYFEAKAILGQIFAKSYTPTDDDIAEGDLLQNLLELLDTAERWQMLGLKRKIEKIIIEEFDLISPETYQHILDEATKVNALSLKRSCEEFKKDNRL
ncbi:hypothetical protein C8J56DRAFT_1031317 [Mycena floridula]|nr:hypothetical protein C8J56DRAFT_1031317 [Mycena floridula]